MAILGPTPKPSPQAPPPGYEIADERSFIQEAINSALGGTGGTGKAYKSKFSQEKVWLGYGPTGGGQSYAQLRMRGYRDEDLLVDYDKARLMPLDWNDSTAREFVNRGIINKIPGFDVNMGMPEIQAAWENMLKSSMLFNSRAGGAEDKIWSPWDVMNSYSNMKGKFGTVQKGDWVFDVATGERIKYVGPRTKTVTDKDVNLSSPEDVKVLVTQMLRELLGRAPNDKELAQFRSSISTYEQAHPEVTTTVQELTPDLATGEVAVTSQSSTTSGGVSEAARAALVQTPTVETKEYGKYQAATTYWDAMMQMIGGS